MSKDDHTITLRLRHPFIDPDVISGELGLVPQHAWRAGEPRQDDDDEAATGVYRETFWVGLLQPAESSATGLLERLAGGALQAQGLLPEFLLFALLKMKRSRAFWHAFVEQGGTIHCLLEVHDPERFHFELSPVLISALLDLRITLAIEVDTAGSRAVAA